MTETDRATLLHAAELLDVMARFVQITNAPDEARMCADLLATARALRDMASGISQS